MRKLLILSLSVFLAGELLGNLALELQFNRSVYMQYEPIYAKLTIRNDSGQPLVFGRNPNLQGEVLFDFSSTSRPEVPLIGTSYDPTGLTLRPTEIKEVIIPLNKYYRVDRPGVYRGHAYVRHPLLQHDFKSNDTFFDVKKGIDIWSRRVGLPGFDSTEGEKIKERIFTIKTLTDLNEKYYYLVVEDEKYIYATMRIGRQIGMEQMFSEIDSLSTLHLLIPVSIKVFYYLQVDADGRIIEDGYYKKTTSDPQLVKNPESGIVSIVGGSEAIAGIDYEKDESIF